jgi:hypothetical protein
MTRRLRPVACDPSSLSVRLFICSSVRLFVCSSAGTAPRSEAEKDKGIQMSDQLVTPGTASLSLYRV